MAYEIHRQMLVASSREGLKSRDTFYALVYDGDYPEMSGTLKITLYGPDEKPRLTFEGVEATMDGEPHRVESGQVLEAILALYEARDTAAHPLRRAEEVARQVARQQLARSAPEGP